MPQCPCCRPLVALSAVLVAAATMLLAAAPAEALEATLQVRSQAVFSRPHDIVLSPHGRYLYVSDVGHDAVQVVNPESLRVVGTIGADTLSGPHDVAFDARGRLLVADSGNDRVAIFAVEGTGGALVGELAGGLGSPEGVAVGPDGHIYVTSASRHHVTVFEGARQVQRSGSRGTGAGEYARPHDVDIDAAGRIHVVDPGNQRIQLLDATLTVVRILGGPGFDFNEPKYVAFDAKNRLYVADEYNNAVKVFDRDFQLLLTIRRAGDEPLNQPEGVTVRGEMLWVSDTYNNRILRYRLSE